MIYFFTNIVKYILLFTHKMENLPTELINIILEYQGYHQLRCGKYIRSIYIDD